MSNLETFTTKPILISASSFYPRNYNPKYLLVKEGMNDYPCISDYISGDIKGGSTPPAYFFYEDKEAGIPFIKTSAVTRHIINVNDLQIINTDYHRKTLKRSIIKPYDVIFTMTGKFMGKAAMCPKTIAEMNMSQNSVVFHTNSKEEAAFLTIFLNSDINRIQIRGNYSITKQKFLNQGKIASLHVVPYKKEYDSLMKEYLSAFDGYYSALENIQKIINKFETDMDLTYKDEPVYSFIVKAGHFDRRMLAPNFYRDDVKETITKIAGDYTQLETDNIRKGDEVGSANYLEEGVPFIKTSDIVNYDLDYEPDCYCGEAFLSQLAQDIKKGDVIFAKDGKPGEVAIVQEDCNVVISSGLVKYHPRNEEEGLWVFLLLASKFGKAYFKKWFVIASTMLHLRADFFEDFKIPTVDDTIRNTYLTPLKKCLNQRAESYNKMQEIRKNVEQSFMEQ